MLSMHHSLSGSRAARLVATRGALLLACTTLACERSVESTAPLAAVAAGPARSATTTTVSAARQADTRRLARGFAIALNQPSLRTLLRHAMRASRLTDHKLVLQDVAHSRNSDVLLKAVAAALGSTPAEVIATIDGLPQIDIYVPFRAHRRAWQGSPDILVASSFEPDAPTLDAYKPDGSIATLRLTDGAPGSTLVILHPAEPKATLPASATSNIGEAIESPTDVASRVVICEVDCGGGGGGGGGVAPGLYVTQFYSYRGDGWWGSLEMEFRSIGWEGAVSYLGNGFWYMDASCSKYTGTATLEPEQNYTNQSILVYPNINSVAGIACSRQYAPTGYEMFAFESDGGLNGNGDDFGRRFFYGGTIPFGAAVGQQLSYYSGGGTPSDGELSVQMTLGFK